MARVSQAPILPRGPLRSADPLTDLNRLLGRLQQSILRADAERERRLISSEFERSKVNVNLEYARALLTRLEQDALATKAHARRQEMQTDLSRKRETLEEMFERMKDLESMGNDGDDGASSSGDEEILANLSNSMVSPIESMDYTSDHPPAPPPLPEEGVHAKFSRGDDSNPARSAEPAVHDQLISRAKKLSGSHTRHQEDDEEADALLQKQPPPETITSQAIRSRGAQQQPRPSEREEVSERESTALSTSRATLFGETSGKGQTSSLTQTATTEAILDQQRAEQELLSASILKMASGLRESSLAFAQSLEEDKSVLNRAGEGLSRNEQGLEATARRMSNLTKIAEGKGWWGRMMLYAWIYGMMVFLVLLVFALPKLRF